jgi:hypothetical protein
VVFVYRVHLILCFIAVLALAPAVTGLAACKSCGDSDRLCGPQCLLHVCQYYGVDADIGELTELWRLRRKGRNIHAGPAGRG